MHHPHHHHHHFCSPRGERFGIEGGPGRGHGPRGEGRGGPDAERHMAHKRERMFEAGGLKLIALHLIGQQPSHGYDIIRAIGELVGGDYQPSPGTIYPTLSYLVDMGHATATELEGGRKQYAITPEGQQALQEQADALQHLLARLAHGKHRGERPAPVVRAIENFKTALSLKLASARAARAGGEGGKALTEAQIDKIAAIIDEAALKIEKA